MAETTLRDYIRTIDNLIDAEKLDEAIAHSRNILQFHPKHLETYRLLGKAYLEAKKHGDAADIFQRVLSAVPDDFVSHIGMSIVREDEGNTESAIWHMERAFETNPSNPAIQQELKRLIGRRDGIEPPKVRLTRGALARMYAHGELYPQAIAELRSALREEPDRPDLQILLADLYWQTDQRVEAAEVSNRILEKLPYCQRALRIMAAALQETGKPEEATRYHRRLAQLDPYFAYVESPMMDTSKVEADSVRIEALAWQPGEPMPGATSVEDEWSSTLGIEIPEDVEGAPLPSWLEDVSEEGGPAQEELARASAVSEPLESESVGVEPPEIDLPDWMEEAGWEPASGEAEEGPVAFSAEELSTLERGELPPEPSEIPPDDPQDLEPAQIPSWLQDKAPGQLPSVEEELAEADIPEWLDDLDMDSEAVVEEPAQDEAPQEGLAAPPWEGGSEPQDLPDIEPADVPSWLEEGEPGATSTIMSWLGDRADEEQPAAESAQGPSEVDESESWIDEAFEQAAAEGAGAPPGDEPTPTEEAQPGSGIPGWLAGMAEASASSEDSEREELDRFRQETAASLAGEGGAGADEELAGDIPDWLQQIADGGQAEVPEPAADLTEEELVAEAEPLAPEDLVEEPVQELPDEFEVEEAVGSLEVEEPAIESEPEGVVPDIEAELETPDWLKETFEPAAEAFTELESQEVESIEAPELRRVEETEEVEEVEGEAEVEDWLANLATGAPQPEAAEEPEPVQDEVEDWLSGLAEPQPEEPEVEGEAATWLADLGEEPQATGQTWAEMTAAEPEWLEGLAEEEPEETVEEMAGGWLDDLSETLAETPAEPPGESADLGAEEVPDWLASFGDQPEPAAEPAAPPAQPEQPQQPEPEEDLSWLQEIAEKASPSEAPAEPEPAAEPQFDMGELDQMDEDEIFQWLENMAAQREQEAAAAPGPEPQPQAEIQPSTAPSGEEGSGEEDLEWLSKLAEQRGIDAEFEPAQPTTPPEPAQPLGEPDTQPTSAVRPTAEEPAQQQEQPPPTGEPEIEPAEQVAEPPPEEALPWETQPAVAGVDQGMPPPIPPEPEMETPPMEAPPGQPPAQAEPGPGVEVPERAGVPPAAPLEAPMEVVEPAERTAPAQPPSEPSEPVPPAEPSTLEPAPVPPPTSGAVGGAAPIEEEPSVTPLPESEQGAVAPAEGEEEVPDWLKPMATTPMETSPAPIEPEGATELPMQEQPTAPPPEQKPEPEPGEPVSEAPPAPAVETPPPEPQTQEPAVAEPPASAPPEVVPQAEPTPVQEQPPEPQLAPEPEPAPVQTREPEPQAEPIREPEPQAEMAVVAQPEPAMEIEKDVEAEPEPEPAKKLPERMHAARAALAEGDHQTAASDYEKLLKLKEHLGQVIEDLESAVEQFPESGALWQTLGDAYMKADRTKDAANAYNEGMRETEVLESARQALTIADYTRAAAQYGLLIKDRKGLETVIEDLEGALEKNEDIPIIWQTLGDAYMKAGRLNDSIKAYRQGMDSV